MTLEKAIVNLGELDRPDTYTLDEDDIASIKLLIEAGKRTRDLRISGRDFHLETLPGETED